MKERSPVWYLNHACPGCGQSWLVLCACPNCAHIVARCDGCDGHDLRTVFFPYARHLSTAVIGDSDGASCPKCGVRELSSFSDATSEQIRNAGFGAGEYR